MIPRGSLFCAVTLVLGVPLLAALHALSAPAADEPAPAVEKASVYEKDILPFLKKHCFSCHGNGKAKADLSFDKFKDAKSVLADPKTWDNVHHMVETRE